MIWIDLGPAKTVKNSGKRIVTTFVGALAKKKTSFSTVHRCLGRNQYRVCWIYPPHPGCQSPPELLLHLFVLRGSGYLGYVEVVTRVFENPISGSKMSPKSEGYKPAYNQLHPRPKKTIICQRASWRRRVDPYKKGPP